MGEAVGGLTARIAFFSLELTTPRWPPDSDFGVHQRNAAQPVTEKGLQLGGLWKTGYIVIPTSKRMAGLWWQSHAELVG